MSEIRSAFVDALQDPGDRAHLDRLSRALGGLELEAARVRAKDEPGSDEAVAAVLGRMLAAGTDPTDVVETAKALAQRAPRDDAGNAVSALVGEVVWKLGGKAQVAEPYFRRVRRSEPAHPTTLQFYRELFGQPAEVPQLVQVLAHARRASTDPELRHALAAEMAALAEDKLGSMDRAIEVWRTVVREETRDERAVLALRRLYGATGKWTALVELLKESFDRIPARDDTATERIERLLEIAELYRDRLQLDAMAVATLQRVLELDPGHRASLTALARTYESTERWNDLLGVYARLIEVATRENDVDTQIHLLRAVARVWLDRLGNAQRALDPLGRLRQLAPGDAEARTMLAAVHERRRDFRALIDLRREEVAGKGEAEARGIRIELARLAEEKLGDRREAIEEWNMVLEHHGDDPAAIEALIRLYERESRWVEAAELMHRKLRAAAEPAAAVALLTALGSIYTDRLRSRPDAVAVWRELLRLQPGHDRAIRMLRDAYVADAAWDDLTGLYAGQGRMAEVVDVLQGAADRVGDVAARVELYRRVAHICNERLAQPERALKALERILAIQPDNLDVARELLPIYREQKDFARLLRTHEVLLQAAGGDEERLTTIAAMRRIAVEDLESVALALRWSARAYEIRPADAGIRAELEQAAEAADGWDELTRLFEARADDAACDPRERLLLLERLAVVARDKLLKPDDAQRYFRRIIDLEPGHVAAMAALQSIYSATRRWEDLCEVHRKRLQATTDPAVRVSTLRSLADILERELGDLGAARECFEQVLTLEPEALEALQGLARIQRAQGAFEALASTLERMLGLTGASADQIALRFELAQLHALRLHDVDRALAGYLAVLERDPRHRGTIEALEGLQRSEPATAVVSMRALLPHYRASGDRPKQAAALRVLIDAETDSARRIELLEQLAEIQERLHGRAADALRTRFEVLRLSPGHWDNRQLVRRLSRENQAVESAVAAYRELLAELAQAATRAEQEGKVLERDRVVLRRDLRIELAAMLRDDLQQPAEAERLFAEVLEGEETHQGAYEALESLLRTRAAHRELVELYRRRVDVIFNPREQRQLLGRIIEIARDTLDDRATAITTAEELLDVVPEDVPTIKLLTELHARGNERKDHESLDELLGRWIELCDDPGQRIDLLLRRAALRTQHLGDAFGAVDLLGQVLAEVPDDPRARLLLEELFDIAEVQLEACSLLEPIYLRVGDHRGRIRVLAARRAHAEAQGAVDVAATRLAEIAAIHERDLGDFASAFAAIGEAYLIDPRRMEILTELVRLGGLLGRDGDLVEVWRRALRSDKVVDKSLRIDLSHRIAVALDRRLHDTEGARKAFTELLALEPPDGAMARDAIESLCRLHLEAGDGVALVAAKRELLRFLDSTEAQVRVRLEIAEIDEQHLGDRVGAALTLSEVLDLDPANTTALDALERLFLEEEEWGRLAELLVHRIGVTADPRAKVALWRQVGEIRQNQLSDALGAVAAYQSILDLKVGGDDAIEALRKLYALHERLERWPDVEEALRRLSVLVERQVERILVLRRLASVVGRKLGRGQDALDLAKRVLDLDPADRETRALVREYLEPEDTRVRAMQTLVQLYEAERDWAALLELEELQARHQPSGRRRLQALLRVAKTHEERLADPARAFAVLCEALQEAADQPELEEVLDKVERLGNEPDRAPVLLGAYEATAGHILDARLQRRVLVSLGTLALREVDQVARARTAYERALELGPNDVEVLDALEGIYRRQGDGEARLSLLLRRAERSPEGPERDRCLIEAAELLWSELRRPEEAIGVYERLSREGLQQPAVQQSLDALYEESGRFTELAAHLTRRLSRLQGRDLVDAHLRLGRLYGERLGSPEEGIRHLGAALRLDPNHAVGTDELRRYLQDPSMRLRVAEMLEPVFTAVHDWARLVEIQEVRLAECEDPKQQIQMLTRIAEVQEEQLEDLDRAFDTYARLFVLEPRNARLREQLQRLAGVLGRLEQYAVLLTDYVTGPAAGDDSDEVLDVVTAAAKLWASGLASPSRAVPLFQRIVSARSGDIEVFSAYEGVLRAANMWRELCDAYRHEAEAETAVARQRTLYQRLAETAADRLGDDDEAVRAYQRILEIEPTHAAARSRLEGIFERCSRFSDLLELLRDRLERTEGAHRRGSVYMRMAEIQRGPLADPSAALETLEALLSEVPDRSDGVAMLEQIARAEIGLRERIVPLLRPRFREQGELQRLVELCQWQLEYVQEPQARQAIHAEIAALWTRAGDTHAAFDALAKAVREPGSPEQLQTLDGELLRLGRATNRMGLVADVLLQAVGSDALADDLERRLELYDQAARSCLERGEPARAADILGDALAVAPEHERTLRRMDEVLTRTGDHERLAEILFRRASAADEDAERVELLRRLGRMQADVLLRPSDAERTFVALLTIDSTDAEALERLSDLYAARGAQPELADVLVRRIEGEQDSDVRRSLRIRLAGLYRERDDRAGEIDTLAASLAETSDDPEVLSLLAEAYLAEQRPLQAAEALEQLAALREGEVAAGHLVAAARLWSGPLADPSAALERYALALGLAPSHADALADLVELSRGGEAAQAAAELVIPRLEAAGRFADLVTVHSAQAALVEDPSERAGALRKVAELRQSRLGDGSGALDAWLAVLDAAEGDAVGVAIDSAIAVALPLGRASDLVDALGSRSADEGREPAVRTRLANAAARLAEEVVADAPRALALLRGLLDAGLCDDPALAAIERLGRARNDLALVGEALRERAGRAEGPAAAEVWSQLGALERERGDDDAALAAFREALGVEPTHAASLAGLRALAEGDPRRAHDAIDLLDRAYGDRGDLGGIADLAGLRLRGVEAVDRVPLLEALGRAAEEAGRAEAAVDAWGELLGLDPESVEARTRIVRFSRSHGLAKRAVGAMREALQKAVARAEMPEALAVATARLQLDELHDAAGALEVLRAVLEAEPDQAEALDLRVSAARALGDAHELHDALHRRAQVESDPQASVAMWREAAEIAEHHLQNLTKAVDDLRHWVAVDEHDAGAWDRLISLLGRGGQADELAEALRQRIVTVDGDERRRLRWTLAGLLAERPHRVDDVIALYEEMLADRPDDVDALRALEGQLRELERWSDVREVLERQVDALSGDARLVAIRQIAALSEEHLDDAAEAIDRYRAILLERPDDAAARASLERLLVAEERFPELADLLEQIMSELRAQGDTEGFRRTASHLAEILAQRMHDVERAQEILGQLLELDPGYVPALLALAAVHEARGEEAAELEVLRRAAELERDPRSAAEIQIRLGKAQRDDAEAAVAHFERALELDSASSVAVDALLDVARNKARWDRVAALLGIKASHTDDDRKRREIAMERVDLLIDRVGDTQGALDVLAEIFERVQDDVEVNRRIADALYASQRFEEAQGMYEWLADTARSGRRDKTLAHYLTRLAKISWAKSQGKNGVRDQLLEAYKIDATNPETLLLLGTMHEAEGNWNDALKIWRALLLQNAERSGLLRRGDLYVGLARAHLGLQERDKARAMVRRGLEEDRDHPELQRVASELA